MSSPSSTYQEEQPLEQEQEQQHPWAQEDDLLARQCEDYDPWNQFWGVSEKKTRKFSDMGLFVVMFLCMSSAMLRIKSR
ncbi:unnamed protein product [Cylindrotheca closterium]|uniref:Uncharacterized protein n=1 Tax=Cylindrotheca closterium TaxID=2856 RepID=A0AAD2G7Z0_9STRA|nr:unnamed protein product [Cylindrotheca closterium]